MSKREREAEVSATRRSTANDRFKASFGPILWSSIVLAAVLHFGLFQFFPELTASTVGPPPGDPPEVIPIKEYEVPPPPEPIPEPKIPIVGDMDPLEDATIPPTTLESYKPVEPPVVPDRGSETGPPRTPFTVAPELRDRAAAVRTIERFYPSLLRDAGIGGEVLVWVHIDTLGVVQETRVQSSSGHAKLDEAALEAARRLEFRPAVNLDRKVAVWVAIPINFSVRR